MIIKAYHQYRGEDKRKIIARSAPPFNPASASMVGMDVIEVKSTRRAVWIWMLSRQ